MKRNEIKDRKQKTRNAAGEGGEGRPGTRTPSRAPGDVQVSSRALFDRGDSPRTWGRQRSYVETR